MERNEYHQIRDNGRPKIFETPEDLLDKANEYFQWCVDNPLFEAVIVAKGIILNPGTEKQQTVYYTNVPKMRPYTIHGLCNYLGIVMKTFYNYKKRDDFLHIITCISQIIYNQKFEGAASGFLNPNIIARDLGLVDKKDVAVDDHRKTVDEVFPKTGELLDDDKADEEGK